MNSEPTDHKYLGLILFVSSALLAITLFLIFHPQIEAINRESPILINLMFIPAMAIGFLYGIKITQRAVNPSEIQSPVKRSIVKVFLFFFVIGGMFSSVNFAINGGSVMPEVSIFEDGLLTYLHVFVMANGGATFLIISSIALMAAATKRIVSSGVFLYTFYQAGIVGGAFYAMNKLTKDKNMISDFTNGY